MKSQRQLKYRDKTIWSGDDEFWKIPRYEYNYRKEWRTLNKFGWTKHQTSSMSILESITISHPTLTTIFLLLVCALILGLIYLKCRYRRPDLRIAIAIVIMGASYAFAFWDYLPKHSVSITEQRLIALIILSLTLFPLFYKSAKRVRIGFTRYTKNERLKKQNHKCAGCKKTLIKFNIDFDHKNGNRSDNRISNCRALCTPCHRKKHAYW